MTTEFYFDPEVQTMFVCSMCSNVITCVTKDGANNHDNEHGKDEHEVGAKHTLALLMMVVTNTIKEKKKPLSPQSSQRRQLWRRWQQRR